MARVTRINNGKDSKSTLLRKGNEEECREYFESLRKRVSEMPNRFRLRSSFKNEFHAVNQINTLIFKFHKI